MVLCAEKHAFIIEHYFRTSSFENVKQRYENKFSDTLLPNNSTIKRVVDHFETVESKIKNRPSLVLTENKMKEILTKIKEKPAMSVKKKK